IKLVVAALKPTPILCWRASGLESPTEVPASTLPALRMAPVRANMASKSVVLPLWKGPTSAMHRGPRGLLTSCPIAASLFGARPMIGSANQMLRPSRRFGKSENRRCAASKPRGTPVHRHCERSDLSAVAQRAKAEAIHPAAKQEWIASSGAQSRDPLALGNEEREVELPSRPKFHAFQPSGDADADLALHAERL